MHYFIHVIINYIKTSLCSQKCNGKSISMVHGHSIKWVTVIFWIYCVCCCLIGIIFAKIQQSCDRMTFKQTVMSQDVTMDFSNDDDDKSISFHTFWCILISWTANALQISAYLCMSEWLSTCIDALELCLHTETAKAIYTENIHIHIKSRFYDCDNWRIVRQFSMVWEKYSCSIDSVTKTNSPKNCNTAVAKSKSTSTFFAAQDSVGGDGCARFLAVNTLQAAHFAHRN